MTHDREYHRDYKREWRKSVTGRQNRMLQGAKHRARRKGVTFTLTIEDIRREWSDICPVLNVPMETGTNTVHSLDRINPALGYVPGNVRVISFRANTIKSDATLAEVLAVAEYLKRETGQQK